MDGNQTITPPSEVRELKRPRKSNLELYRIIVMLLIVAHHYVVNSGLFEVIQTAPLSSKSIALVLFGAWGKTGINCFVMITGWFMCTSRFTWQKFIKLYLQIAFYAVVIYGIFCVTGQETFHPVEAVLKLFPIRSISDGFVSCFMIFYLLIPFLNILIRGMNRKEHTTLLLIVLTVYTLLPTSPWFHLSFNYVSWFAVIYLLAAYIRFHGFASKISHKTWGWLALTAVLVSAASVLGLFLINKLGYTEYFLPYFLISDSNKILALTVAVTSFMWFKDLRIPHSKLVNAIGGATFGVLLIHANSDTMRQWLWRETVDCVGHFGESLLWVVGYATVSVIVIFVICAGIDWFRGCFIEPHLMNLLIKETPLQHRIN